jgi:uncharacterized protein (DUF4415 family)
MGMPESESRKRWVKENKQFFGFKLHKKLDEDIIKFLEGKQYATVIKLALREYMEHHKEDK